MTIITALEALDPEARADADALVLWQVAARAAALLEALAAGKPSQEPLQVLLGYLRNVVLARIAEEDTVLLEADESLRIPPAPEGGWDLDPAQQEGHHIDLTDIRRARQEHLLIRGDIEDLAEAHDAGPSGLDAPEIQRLSEVIHRLVSRLEVHLAHELVTLTEVGTPAAVATWPSVLRWYPMAEASLLDLSAVPAKHARGVLLSKVLAMTVGEQLDVTGRRDLEQLGPWLQHSHPGRLSWSIVRDHDAAMRLSVTLLAAERGSQT
jgi:hypothetical protein